MENKLNSYGQKNKPPNLTIVEVFNASRLLSTIVDECDL